MKILLISDTHGKLDKFFQVYSRIENIDLIIHCGDYQKDATAIKKTINIPVVSVIGNCDVTSGDLEKIVETPYGNLLVLHGHNNNVNYNYNNILYKAEENDCIGVCYGHTHIPLNEALHGIHLINPGSLSTPRDGSNGSVAVINSTEDSFFSNIVYYDTLVNNKPKKKVQGGFLRGLLNYSDRF